jgi:hypothetical protein
MYLFELATDFVELAPGNIVDIHHPRAFFVISIVPY